MATSVPLGLCLGEVVKQVHCKVSFVDRHEQVVVEVASHNVAADASGGQLPGDGCSEADSV